MSKNLEYAIMIFLLGFLVIMFRWSENDKYYVMTNGNTLLNTQSGEVWNISSSGKKLVEDYKPTLDPRVFQKDLRRIVDEINKDIDKAKD